MANLIQIFRYSVIVVFLIFRYENSANADCTTSGYPHLLEMIYDDNEHITNRPLCLGTAISKTEVLTNVNCLPKTADLLYVRQANYFHAATESLIKTKAINFTTNYNIHFLFTMYENVAKVTLAENLPDCIIPARKITETNDDLELSIFYGRYVRTENPLTLTLNIASIPVKLIPNSECNTLIGTLYDTPIPKGVTNAQLCVRYNKTEQRDSLPMLGGPLQVKLDDGYGIIGTVSYYQSLQNIGLAIITPID